MRKLVIYDSQFGNTKTIAEKIAEAAGAEAILVTETRDTDWNDVSLLVVGSPTQAGRPTMPVFNLISKLPENSLQNTKVASFDTRFDEKNSNLFLKLVMKTIKYAAEKIDRILISKGGQQVVKPAGFIVTGKEGPLKDGEEGRAFQWGENLVRG